MATEHATISDCETLLGEQLREVLGLAEGESLTGNAALTKALSVANSRVDASIRARYGSEIPNPDPVLNELAVKLAFFFLLERQQETMTDTDREMLERVEKDLDRIATGKMALTFPARNDTAAVVPVAIAEVGKTDRDTRAEAGRQRFGEHPWVNRF